MPHQDLEKIAPSLWIHTQDFAMQGVEVGTRSILIEYAPEKLMLICPGPSSVPYAEHINALGQMAHIVAPNGFHHLYLPKAAKHWPEAQVWGPGAVKKKQPDVALTQLEPDFVFPWQDTVKTLATRGTLLQEYVFFHEASRTLVVTDLVFNVLHPKGWKAHLLTFVMGTRGKLACSRLIKRVALKDRAAFKQSLQTILKWDFERIVMAHGEVLEKNARNAFTQAMAFVLE